MCYHFVSLGFNYRSCLKISTPLHPPTISKESHGILSVGDLLFKEATQHFAVDEGRVQDLRSIVERFSHRFSSPRSQKYGVSQHGVPSGKLT